MLKIAYQKIKLSQIILIALITRLLLWPWTYHGDITATYWWGKYASEFGLRGFYDWLNFSEHSPPDQPMLNIFYDLFIRNIYQFIYNFLWYLNLNIPLFPSKLMQWYFIEGNQYLLKIPMILADLVLIYFCYKFTKSKLIAFFLALSLPLIYNSSVWGSGDSIINLLALGSVYLLYHKRYSFSAVLYLCSILYKPSLLIWAPILLVIFIKTKPKAINILNILILLVCLIIAVSLPFYPLQANPLIWFYQTLTSKILPGYLNIVTANALNFWSLIYSFNPIKDNIVLFNIITARQLSLLICSGFYILILKNLFQKFSTKTILLSLVNISLITFCFMTRMHERYSYPALIPLLLLTYYDKKYYKYFLGITLTHFLNVYIVFKVPYFPYILSIISSNTFIRALSLINILLIISLVYEQLKQPIQKITKT